jgi:hypothetical protein
MARATPHAHGPTPGWLRWLAVGGSAGITATTIGDPRLGALLLVLLEVIIIPGVYREAAPDAPHREPAIRGAHHVRYP